MSLSFHAATVPTMLQILETVAANLDKAEEWCRERGLPDEELTQARLSEDMWPFANQIRSVWQHSAGAMQAVLTGEYWPDFSPPPSDFAGLKALVADARQRVLAVNPAEFDARIDAEAVFKFTERQTRYRAEDYVFSFAQPNFFFHSSIAYAILRMKGVELGKKDYLGKIRPIKK